MEWLRRDESAFRSEAVANAATRNHHGSLRHAPLPAGLLDDSCGMNKAFAGRG
jgi:hypothetical protein